MARYDAAVSNDAKLNVVLKQAWFSGLGNGNELYSTFRRTGLPALTPHPDGVLPAIPTRFPYAQDEITYNGANVPSVNISDKLWWDK